MIHPLNKQNKYVPSHSRADVRGITATYVSTRNKLYLRGILNTYYSEAVFTVQNIFIDTGIGLTNTDTVH